MKMENKPQINFLGELEFRGIYGIRKQGGLDPSKAIGRSDKISGLRLHNQTVHFTDRKFRKPVRASVG